MKKNVGYIIFILIGIALIGLGTFGTITNSSSNSEKEENIDKEDNTGKEDSNEVILDGAVCGGTGYVASSKRSAYVDTLVGYIYSIRVKVNMSEDIQLFDVNTLYLIPVGKEGTCAFYERGGGPVFGEEWKSLFVGVTYNGKKYDYYVISLEDSGCGVDFISDDDLYKSSSDIVKKVKLTVDLTSIYENLKKNVRYADLDEIQE